MQKVDIEGACARWGACVTSGIISYAEFLQRGRQDETGLVLGTNPKLDTRNNDIYFTCAEQIVFSLFEEHGCRRQRVKCAPVAA